MAIVYQIPDSWIHLLNHGYDFSFDHMAGENREYFSTSLDENPSRLVTLAQYEVAKYKNGV